MATEAERSRSRRAYRRQKDGRKCLRPAVKLHRFLNALIDAGELTADETANEALVNDVAAQILDRWAVEVRAAPREKSLTRENTSGSKLAKYVRK